MYVTSTAGGENDEMEEIAIPNFGDEVEYDIPLAPAELRDLVKRLKVLFSTVPGSTTVAHHTIPTADYPPVRVPPRRVPAIRLKSSINEQKCWIAAAHGSLQLYMSQRSLVR